MAALAGGSQAALAQKPPAKTDGVYDFKSAPHTGTLAVKTARGGLLFDVSTVSPKGATCTARGKALGGTALTFKDGEAGFRLKLDHDRTQITLSGLIGRVSETPFCGLGAMLTGVYKRSGALDAKTAAELVLLDKPAGSLAATPAAAKPK